MDITPYLDDFGFINCDNVEKHGENGILFSAEYIITSNPVDREFQESVCSTVENKLYNGHVYKGRPGDVDYVSLDNLTAICSLRSDFAQNIYNECKRQWFRYDNLNPEKPSWNRIQQPRDIIYYGCCAGSTVCFLLFPILFLFMFMSMLSSKQSTSGKMLALVRCQAMRRYFIFRASLTFFSGMLKLIHNQTFTDVAFIYFKSDARHPVVANLYRIYGV